MGRLTLYIVGGIVGFSVLTGIYYQWRKGIEREALFEYNQKQIEQNIKDQEELKRKLIEIGQKQKEIEDANNSDKKIFKDKMDAINTDIVSTNTVDRPSSDVLKKTVNKLKDVVK